jgi:hypothetical protein
MRLFFPPFFFFLPRLFCSIFFYRVFGRFVTRGVQKRHKKKSRENLLSFQKKHSLTYVAFFFFFLRRPLPVTRTWESSYCRLSGLCACVCSICAVCRASPMSHVPSARQGTGVSVLVLVFEAAADPKGAALRLLYLCVCVCVCCYFPLQGNSPVPRGGGSAAAQAAARSTRPHALQASSAAHHALPVSGQSSVVHVSLCRCVSCALCENLRAPNRTPHPSRCALPVFVVCPWSTPSRASRPQPSAPPHTQHPGGARWDEIRNFALWSLALLFARLLRYKGAGSSALLAA